MDSDRFLSMIGLATKAGKVKSGEFAVLGAITGSIAFLVVVTEDMGSASYKKLSDKCAYYKVPLIKKYTREELGRACGQPDRSSIAVCDAGFAKALLKIAEVSAEEKH